MPTVRVRDIEMYYETRGTGPPLLVLAGFACDHTHWSPAARSLSATYRVVLADNRGVGRSSAPDAPYSVRQMADDAAALLDRLGIATAHVAGHSMGGTIAQELALAYPEKVRTLTLVAAMARPDAALRERTRAWGDLARTADYRTFLTAVLPWAFSDTLLALSGGPDAAAEFLADHPFRPTPHGLYHQSRAVLEGDTSGRLGAIRCPTLVLAGRQDALTPLSLAEVLATGIPNAELVVLDAAGHSILVESPELAVPVILGFLARHPIG